MATEHAAASSVAVLGGGCFWCLEAVFEATAGVLAVESGYAGGHAENPDYRAVCSGNTGHAEVVRISYDPAALSYQDILLIFFGVHDPTSVNRQGADVGTQYRSIILTTDADQRRIAEQLIGDLERDRVFDRRIVTEVKPLDVFYPAEAYHQDYYRQNPAQGYCQAVIAPKLAKFRAAFRQYLRED
ncbi:MAG: peptide-methionine (S)-S-oxide reductase MsrA [Candidatus Krumholzibacteria bacterium]|nr:peptide-methionine (S)-S-oxide reductase MsrA [Candidatus Krumholzibacteria bacterium]